MKQEHQIIQEQDGTEDLEVVNLSFLEVDTKQFKPHYGNSFVFLFRNGKPLITLGPHWPLSICLLNVILFSTYFIQSTIMINKNWIHQVVCIVSGLYVATMFVLTVLINPGINTAQKQQPYLSDYCKPCNMLKLSSTVHCFDCDICVLDHDHHCPWTGKCIGKGNVVYFQMFICAMITYFIANLFILVF